METITILVGVLQSMGISLGVGGSTLAILNFFYAISDGKIDETERNFMGITYTVLRVAMGVILFTALAVAAIGYSAIGTEFFGNYIIAQAILVFMLFFNAFLMTKRVMPSTFGPAIQASSWYSLGFLAAFMAQGITNISIWVFLFAYAALIFFAISLINGVMAYLKAKRLEQDSSPSA